MAVAVGFIGAGSEQVEAGVEAKAGAGVVLVHFGYCCCLAAAGLCSEQRCWRS